jgi:hypothetical protein
MNWPYQNEKSPLSAGFFRFGGVEPAHSCGLFLASLFQTSGFPIQLVAWGGIGHLFDFEVASDLKIQSGGLGRN